MNTPTVNTILPSPPETLSPEVLELYRNAVVPLEQRFEMLGDKDVGVQSLLDIFSALREAHHSTKHTAEEKSKIVGFITGLFAEKIRNSSGESVMKIGSLWVESTQVLSILNALDDNFEKPVETKGLDFASTLLSLLVKSINEPADIYDLESVYDDFGVLDERGIVDVIKILSSIYRDDPSALNIIISAASLHGAKQKNGILALTAVLQHVSPQIGSKIVSDHMNSLHVSGMVKILKEYPQYHIAFQEKVLKSNETSLRDAYYIARILTNGTLDNESLRYFTERNGRVTGSKLIAMKIPDVAIKLLLSGAVVDIDDIINGFIESRNYDAVKEALKASDNPIIYVNALVRILTEGRNELSVDLSALETVVNSIIADKDVDKGVKLKLIERTYTLLNAFSVRNGSAETILENAKTIFNDLGISGLGLNRVVDFMFEMPAEILFNRFKDEFSELLSTYPDEDIVLALQGLKYFESGSIDEARSIYNSIVGKDSSDRTVILGLLLGESSDFSTSAYYHRLFRYGIRVGLSAVVLERFPIEKRTLPDLLRISIEYNRFDLVELISNKDEFAEGIRLVSWRIPDLLISIQAKGQLELLKKVIHVLDYDEVNRNFELWSRMASNIRLEQRIVVPVSDVKDAFFKSFGNTFSVMDLMEKLEFPAGTIDIHSIHSLVNLDPNVQATVRSLDAKQRWKHIIGSMLPDEVLVMFDGINEFENVVAEWKSSNERKPMHAVVANALVAYKLEKLRSGIFNTLHRDFGITNVARYPIESLIKQYDGRNDDMERYVVVQLPKGDQNGAFSRMNLHLYYLGRDLDAHGYGVRFIEAGYGVALLRRAVHLERLYPSSRPAGLVISGHGASGVISLGKQMLSSTSGAEDVTARAVKRFLSKGAPVVFNVCDSSELGKSFSRIHDGVVVGSSDVSTFDGAFPIYGSDGELTRITIDYGKTAHPEAYIRSILQK